MTDFKFEYNNKEYILTEQNFEYFNNDEEKPAAGIDREVVLNLLNQADNVNFEIQYYGEPCPNCLKGKAEREKVFRFLEYHFFIFTKASQYVISDISKERKTSFTQMEKQGIADDSYVVSVIVCENCGNYSIEIEQCEI